MKTDLKIDPVLKGLKSAFAETIGSECKEWDRSISAGLFHPEGPYKEVILASYEPKSRFLNIDSMLVAGPIEGKNIPDLLEILNAANVLLFGCFLCLRVGDEIRQFAWGDVYP